MSLDLTAVECFVAVARHGHFGAAAEDLGVSVSAVTKRLQRLEAALGCRWCCVAPAGSRASPPPDSG